MSLLKTCLFVAFAFVTRLTDWPQNKEEGKVEFLVLGTAAAAAAEVFWVSFFAINVGKFGFACRMLHVTVFVI